MTDDAHHLELIVKSRIPLVVIDTFEEDRALRLLTRLALRLALPLFRWTVTLGLQRLDVDMPAQRHNSEPGPLLNFIKGSTLSGLYVLADFHPYVNDPMHVRLLKDIALDYARTPRTIVFLSHELALPPELRKLSARLTLALPDEATLRRIVEGVAREWADGHGGRRVKADGKAFELLVRNLSGLTEEDARRLARNAIFNDGALTSEDLPRVMEAKYRLFDTQGVLSYEYDTPQFSQVGGLQNLKRWLELRRRVFIDGKGPPGIDPPRGILLLGVQGCGKSLAAKATAGVFGVPLLRLDFGALYNKYHGESERNLRETLKSAEAMAPCVLWLDELEKGLAADDSDSGTSRRVLGTLLTWMAERPAPVFLTATANDIERLPPELMRKGRFDEIFFVDLPSAEVRAVIFSIHLKKRRLDPAAFDLKRLVGESEGFSGAEIEQAIVSALYGAHAAGAHLTDKAVSEELSRTRPLSVIMAERVQGLRAWARERTVPAD